MRHDSVASALYGMLSSGIQNGDILYPDKVFYTIGNYKDDNEHFPHQGVIDELRIYTRALSEAEVVRNMNASGLAVNPTGKLASQWSVMKQVGRKQ